MFIPIQQYFTLAAVSLLYCTTMILNFLLFNILLIFIFETSTTFVYSFSSNVTDEQALLSFKYSITDDPSGVLDSWNNSIHFCHWTGVRCSRRRQRVTSLNLSSLHLVGTLPPHIGNLSLLRRIYIYQNNFHGPIPNEIGRLIRLQSLRLEFNSFQGVYPANLSHCVDIRNISMGSNDLEGKLPTDFSSWSKLEMLSLEANNFTGSIPSSIGNISSLRILSLGDNNHLGGRIPFDVSHLAKLEILNLSGNKFSGMVPLQVYNNSFLYIVDLNENELEGTLPTDLGFTLPKLQAFYVGGNRFSGPLPPSIVNASNLVRLEISGNNVTGPIPNNLGSLSNLQILHLGHNPVGAYMRANDLSFFSSLVNCTQLKMLGIEETELRGQLPNSIVNLSITMEILNMHGNRIHGSIPGEIGKLVNMRVLSLSYNLLTRTIPESIGTLSKLGVLDLSENNISGSIPNSIGNFTQLVLLFLKNNMLQGSVPTQLFNISTLEILYLGNNRLRGVIPDEIGVSSHCLYLDLSMNLFTGPLPSNIGNLKQLVGLDLSYNKLTGDIPVTLDGCLMLEELYMEGNHFQGKIPSSFKALKNLAFIDLSNNNLSGSIPSFFDGFQLIFLNLSHNKLGGQVSKKGLFSNVSAFSIIGNLELCGGIQALHLPTCPVKVSRNKKKAFSLRMILILVLVPLGILLACLALISYRRKSSKKLNVPIPVLKDDSQYPKLSYQDLLLATNEFSPHNLIGEGRYGSVYKGFLKSVEHIVAVKVLKVEVRGANKSFLAECEMLRNIRHRNLIKILTTCSSIDHKGNDFKALVFEFMTNGSVDTWLHPSPSYQGNKRNLTLFQRLNIAIDVALGVDYLHHHSHASIIHSDIKPSNILLDEDFVAHVGDFGLARFSFVTRNDIIQEQMSSTGVRGTVGYVPPEYGMFGEISTEGDVYSFGIFVLEMFSGKRPTESNTFEDGSNNLHDYVRKALPQRVMNIVDPRIALYQEEHGFTVNSSSSKATLVECLESIFQVGIICSEESPRKRIDISVAIKQLHVARDKLLLRRQ